LAPKVDMVPLRLAVCMCQCATAAMAAEDARYGLGRCDMAAQLISTISGGYPEKWMVLGTQNA